MCLASDTNTPGETITVNVSGVPAFDVELCPEHGAALSAAVAALAPLGRGVGKGVPKVPTSAGKARQPAQPAQPEPARRQRADEMRVNAPCPECGHVTPTLAAMRGHLYEKHGKSLADVGLAPAKKTCPECGSKFSNGQGLAAHVRIAHPAAYARQKRSA